ncbi:protein takeout [Halyomorpha halys]|uniref:protein takeout n=1 Tax=Halyomorpha halys TaxID=286706 RepID=UPI0006D50A49|nr:protein takeout-like [Halyomorpha halys]
MSQLTVFFVFLFAAGSWAAMPHGWQSCPKSSKDHIPCLIKQVNKAIQTLKGGSKPLAVNPLDPLRILTLKIDQGSGPVSIKLEFKDTDISGLSTCVLKTLTNKDWKRLEGTGTCKTLDVNGKYKIDGKILALPIQGEGDSKVHLDEVNVVVSVDIKEIDGKDGKKHFSAESFNFVITPTKQTFNFENLFNGNKALADNMNTFLNENGEQIFKELQPAISKALSQAFSVITNQIFSKIPSNEINVK